MQQLAVDADGRRRYGFLRQDFKRVCMAVQIYNGAQSGMTRSKLARKLHYQRKYELFWQKGRLKYVTVDILEPSS